MKYEDVKVGMFAIIDKKGSPYDGMEGKVLSVKGEFSEAEHIRLRLEETSEIVGGFLASELQP